MRDWVTNVRDTHYLIGSAIGPHPFPTIVRDFQSVIGEVSLVRIAVASFPPAKQNKNTLRRPKKIAIFAL